MYNEILAGPKSYGKDDNNNVYLFSLIFPPEEYEYIMEMTFIDIDLVKGNILDNSDFIYPMITVHGTTKLFKFLHSKFPHIIFLCDTYRSSQRDK